MKFIEALEKTAFLKRWDKTRVHADIGRHLAHMGQIKHEKRMAAASGVVAAAGGSRYLRNRQHEKTADAAGSPMIDPKKAAQMQKGALSGGTSMGQAWSNLKSGLGFGGASAASAAANQAGSGG